MSGIEVAGLVVGIVPIVVAILKSNSALQTRLRTFTRYIEAIRAIQLRHKVVATNFSVNCQLLLKAVVDDAYELSQMLDDPKHTKWRDPDLEERLQKFLGQHSQVLEDVVVKIRDVLQETGAQLSKLDQCLTAEGHEDATKTAPTRRLLNAFRFSFQEKDYSKCLHDLEEWSTRLSVLRAQLCTLRKRRSRASNCILRKSVPNHYRDIRTVSQTLHNSLRSSFSCTNISHVDHQAKLSLDVQAGYDCTQLDMVITCRRKPSLHALKEPNKPSSEPPIWLHIKSVTAYKPTTNIDSMLPGIPAAGPASTRTPAASVVSTGPQNDLTPPKFVSLGLQKSLKKRVHFEASDGGTEPAPGAPAKAAIPRAFRQLTTANYALLNLKTTPSVCCHLSRACQSAQCKELGYLESSEAPQLFTFVFYDAARNTEANLTQAIPSRKSCSVLTELVRLQTLHQLTLAYKLATTVLQYYSTSWLPDDWGLEHIEYFFNAPLNTPNKSPIVEEDFAHALQTLHLSTQFPQKIPALHAGQVGDPEQLRYMYGIRNLPLAKLGIALLEICTKQALVARTPETLWTPEGVVAARKILHEKPPLLSTLGNRYLKVAQQCINCDFSCGEDLSDEALRGAVYTDVVCVLEDMIANWKKLMGME